MVHWYPKQILLHCEEAEKCIFDALLTVPRQLKPWISWNVSRWLLGGWVGEQGGVSGQKIFFGGKIRFESYIIRILSRKSKSKIFTSSWPLIIICKENMLPEQNWHQFNCKMWGVRHNIGARDPFYWCQSTNMFGHACFFQYWWLRWWWCWWWRWW